MTMNLDVVVRLKDETRAAGRSIEAFLRRLSTDAGRINARGGTASGIRGVASAFRRLNQNLPSDTAISRIDRFQTAIGRLAGQGTEIGASAGAINKMTRAVDNLSKKHKEFERAARNADLLSRAMAKMPKSNTGFVAGATAQLNQLINLQRQAIGHMNTLNGGGGGRGRRGMGGAGGTGGGGQGAQSGNGGLRGPVFYEMVDHAKASLADVYGQASQLQDIIIRLRGQGLSDSEIAQVQRKADEIASSNKSINRLGALNVIAEARTALSGDTKEAMNIAPAMAQFRQIMQRYLPADKANEANEQMYDMARAGELRNEINDPARFSEMMKSMAQYAVFTNGRVMPRDFHKNILYGRGALQGVSDDFVNDRLGFYAQELGNGSGGRGGPAGVALRALFQQVVMGVQKKGTDKEWRKIGMWDHGHVADRDLATTDPDKFLAKVMQAMVKAGITDKTAQVQMLGKLFTTGTAQTAAFVGGFQQDRLEAFVRAKHQVLSPDMLQQNAGDSLSGSVQNLRTQMDALAGTIGSQLAPLVTPLVKAFSTIIEVANTVAKVGGTPLTVGVIGATIPLAMRALASSAMMRGMLGGLLGSAAGPAGALAGATAGVRGGAMFAGLARMAPGIGTAIGVAAAAAWMQGTAHSLTGWLFDKLTPQSNQDAVRKKYQSIHDEAVAAQADPKASWWSKFLAGRRQSFADSYLEDHPIAGARARGGPVAGGRMYLVGEHGPELFTAGRNGGITSNADLNRLGGIGEDNGETGHVLAQAIRYQTFALANAIDKLGNRSGGSNKPEPWSGYGNTPEGSGGSGGGGGGEGSSGSGGGRRRGARGGGGGGDAPQTPLQKAGISESSVAPGLQAFGLNGRRITLGRRGLSRDQATRLGIGTVDPNAFRPSGSDMPATGKADPKSFRGTLFGGESGGNPGIYNYMAGGRWHAGHFDAANTTIGQIQAMQAQGKGRMFATGLYQVIPSTLREAVKKLHLNASDKYNTETQNRIFTDFLAGSKRPQIGAFIRGQGSIEKANLAMAEEWASVADPYKGGMTSHYRSDRASISVEKAQASLRNAKSIYDDLRTKGISEQQAMRSALLGVRDSATGGKSTSVGAFGLSGFTGVTPSAPRSQVPDAIAEKAKHDREQKARSEKLALSASPKRPNITIGDIHVHAQPHHDAEQVADLVHRKFRDAARHQYSDGAFA